MDFDDLTEVTWSFDEHNAIQVVREWRTTRMGYDKSYMSCYKTRNHYIDHMCSLQ